MIKSGKIVALETEGKTSKATGRSFSVHSVVLEDGTRVEVGFKQPYMAGTYFNRTVEMKFGKLTDVGPAAPGETEVLSPSSLSSTSRAAGPTGRTFPVGIDSPEMSIIRQNALTNARELVSALFDMTPANVGVAETASKADRQQYLDARVEDILYVAYKFTDFSSGQREQKLANEQNRLNPPSV